MTDAAATWDLPDDELGTTALRLVFDDSPEVIANHCVRSYVFARELATVKGLHGDVDYDDQAVYLACLLHDLGVTPYGIGNQRFEADGADAAARLLREHAVPDTRVTTVWQSIALHTSLGLAHKFGVEQAIVQSGISLDVDGAEKYLLTADFTERVHAAWPRHNLGYGLADVIAEGIRSNPAKGPPFTFPGHLDELLNGTRRTFVDVIRHSGWGDFIPDHAIAP